MSHVINREFGEDQAERLNRLGRQLGRTPSEMTALLVEEALRTSKFRHVEFRNSIVGRQAYIESSSLAVWEVVMLNQDYGGDAPMTAEHLRWPLVRVQAALDYAAAFPVEIDTAISENDACDFASLSRIWPQAREIHRDDPK